MGWLGDRGDRRQAEYEARRAAANERFAAARQASREQPDSLARSWSEHRARRELYRSQGYSAGWFRRHRAAPHRHRHGGR